MSRPQQQDAPLVDGFGRRVDYLRLSLLDGCNLRCQYCMPAEGLPFLHHRDWLDFDAIVLTLRVASRLGVHRVRLTGGEPLMRPGLPELVRRIKTETPIAELALTTNGLLLEAQAEPLAKAGLDRLNVSLDSLDEGRFVQMARRDGLEQVWRGLRAAARAGLAPLKINTVLMAGFNEDEVDRWVALTREHALTVRFLEVMPIGEAGRAGLGFVDVSAVRARLVAQYGLEPAQAKVGGGPARYWRVPGAPGMVGFITPISDRYCDTCTRVRLTASGDLRPCLAFDVHVPMGQAIRSGDEAAIEAAFREAARQKPAGHHWEAGQLTRTSMSVMGG